MNGKTHAIDEDEPFGCKHSGLVSVFEAQLNVGAPLPSLEKYVEGMVDESAQRVWALKVKPVVEGKTMWDYIPDMYQKSFSKKQLNLYLQKLLQSGNVDLSSTTLASGKKRKRRTGARLTVNSILLPGCEFVFQFSNFALVRSPSHTVGEATHGCQQRRWHLWWW